MTDYTELVKALRYCANNPCSDECQWWHPDRKREVWSCVGKNLTDAAAAIEALQAKNADIREELFISQRKYDEFTTINAMLAKQLRSGASGLTAKNGCDPICVPYE